MVAIRALALSVKAATTVEAKARKQLVVDTVFRFSTTGATLTLDKGERFYEEFDLFVEGTFGTEEEEQIGEGKWYGVSTEPAGTEGWWESMTIQFFDEDVIEGVDTALPWKGAIIGGTGVFAGASGEYSGIELGGDPSVSRITFTFQKPVKLAR